MRSSAVTAVSSILFGVLTCGVWFALRPRVPALAPREVPTLQRVLSLLPDLPPERSSQQTPPHTLKVPSGAPASLRCDQARQIIAEARTQLASAPGAVDPSNFAEAVIDWLDPHGLWSAAPDSPVADVLRAHAAELRDELEGGTRCSVAEAEGEAVAQWVTKLRHIAEEARAKGVVEPPSRAAELAAKGIFEEAEVTRPARELAAELGSRLGTLERSLGPTIKDTVDAAFERAFPSDDIVWSDVVLAAAVRAYIPQIDPHGGWAPFDEETSLYEISLEANPPPQLWRKMTRTALGLRIDEASVPEIPRGAVVLAVGDVSTALLGVEQAEQISLVDVEPPTVASAQVTLLDTQGSVRTVNVRFADASNTNAPAGPSDSGYEYTRIPFGDSDALVIPIGDVPDDLGDDLAATLAHARNERPFSAVLLDLRGNGGGSTDGAAAAIGLFLPGVNLFPFHRRDGSIEVDPSATPPVLDRWTGPLATLVDGNTASAAEMIAGGLASYRRAPIVGARTFGKGCAQEYVEDDVHAGVLRLTTLVYSLPDGSPVQQIGLSPWFALPLPKEPTREALLSHSQPPWGGPDVRTMNAIHEIRWPMHHGHIGPCKDSVICRALRLLGAAHGSRAQARP